jgi:hypothetical protein
MFILERTANANADGDADVVGQTQAEPERGAADTRRWLLLDRVAGRVMSPTPPLDRCCWSLLWATGVEGGVFPFPPAPTLVVLLGIVTGVACGDLYPRSEGNGGGFVMHLRQWEGDPTRCTDVGGRNRRPRADTLCVCVITDPVCECNNEFGECVCDDSSTTSKSGYFSSVARHLYQPSCCEMVLR